MLRFGGGRGGWCPLGGGCRCRQLLSEQEVQARAADAARANVEAHYNYILNSYQTFLDK